MTVKIQKLQKQIQLTAGQQNLSMQPRADTIAVQQQQHFARLGTNEHSLKLQSIPDGIDEVVLIASATPASTALQTMAPRLRLVTTHPDVDLHTEVVEPTIETVVKPLTLQLMQALNVGIAGSHILPATCDATDQVGDLVYAYAPLSGLRYEVRHADPTDLSKMPAWAVIISKSSDTECSVQWAGPVANIFGGLTVGARYWVGLSGRPELTPPSLPGAYQQVVGIAVDTNQLFLFPQLDIFRPRLYQRLLVGAKDGFNVTYTTPEKFRPDTLIVYRNGVTQEQGGDYVALESGGPGTGYDTVRFGPQLPPLAVEKLFADYGPAL
jgi:hypothetical protein